MYKYLHTCENTYINRYIQRERERERSIYVCIHMNMCIYTYMNIYI